MGLEVVAAKSKGRKSKAKAPPHFSDEPPQLGHLIGVPATAYGATAGMPLFLDGSRQRNLAVGGPTEATPRTLSSTRFLDAVSGLLAMEPGVLLNDSAAWSARIGADVSHARIVTGDRATRAGDALNARAFTVGARIFLGERGGSALPHELVHVAQQRDAQLPPEGLGVTSPTSVAEREASNGYTGAPSRATLAIARQEDDQEITLAPPVASGEYYENNKMFIWSHARELIEKTEMDVGSRYARWTYSAQSFFWGLQKRLEALGWAELYGITRPQNLDAGIKSARRQYSASIEPNTAFSPWEEYRVVGNEIAIRINPLIPAALARVVPQFVAATYVAMKKERAATHEPFEYMYPQPKPEPGSVVALAPIDKLVIDVLLDPMSSPVSVDGERYEKDGKDPQKDLIQVGVRAFEWQVAAGNPLWIKVIDPPNARAEDVAATLYGDSSKGAAVVSASPYFGFYPDLLDFAHRGAFEAALGGKSVPATVLNPFDPGGADDLGRWARAQILDPGMDPALGKLKGPVANAIALAQALKFPPTGKGRDEIVARMRETVALLDGIRTEADSMNELGSMVTPVRDLIDARSKDLGASEGDAEAIKWDAQSQAQNQVVHRAANGVHHAVELYRGFAGTNSPAAEMMKDLAPFLRAALDRSVTDFLLGAVQADLVETATATLDRADLRSKEFPLDLLDGILNWIRWVLASPKVGLHTIDLGLSDPYGVGRMKEMEQKFRAKLFEARDLIVTDPTKVQTIIDEIQQDIFDLQSSAVVAETVSEIANEMNVLLEQQTTLGSINWDWWVTPIGEFSESKNDEYERNRDYLKKFYFDFRGINESILDPSPEVRAGARARLRALQPRVEDLRKALANIAAMIQRREEQEHWIGLGLKIAALIAIAIATAGVGSYVSGALLVGAGWGTTTAGVLGAAVVSSGAEAATFTLLSTAILGTDPQQSLLETFLTNWALFGALKGLSLAYEGVVGAKAAATLVGKGGNITLGLAASIGYSLMDQNDKIKAAGGKGLSDAQATETVVTQLVVFIGTALVGRYAGKSFFEGAYIKGAESPFAEQFRIVDASRAEAYKAALRISQSGGKIGDARDALSKDADALKAEKDLLRRIDEEIARDPDIVRNMGLNLEAIQQAQSLNALQYDANVRAQISVELEVAAGDLFRCQPGRLDAIATRLQELGDAVEIATDPVTGNRIASVKPKNAPPMRIIEPAEKLTEATAQPTTGPSEQTRLQLARMRAMLAPDAQTLFDRVVDQLGAEKALKKLEGMSKSRDGLEEQLRKEAEKEAAKLAPKKPFGEALDKVGDLQSDVETLRQDIRKSDVPGMEAWLKRLNHEMNLLDEMGAGGKEATPERVQGVRNNVDAIRAEHDDAVTRGVDRANAKIMYTDQRGAVRPLDIDNAKGKTWSEIKNKNPFTTASEDWSGEVQPKAEKMLVAASQHGITEIRFSFPKGVDPTVKAALEAMNPAPGDTTSPRIVVDGDIVMAGPRDPTVAPPILPPPPPPVLGPPHPSGYTPINILVVGAEQPHEFAYATQAAQRGANVTVVNPVATPAAQTYAAAGGNFVQGVVEGLPATPTYQIISEDFPFPLGRAFEPTVDFARQRLTRLAPGGVWVVVTESAEFAQTLSSVVEMEPGYSVTTTEVPIAHETTPQSPYAREQHRFVLAITRAPSAR